MAIGVHIMLTWRASTREVLALLNIISAIGRLHHADYFSIFAADGISVSAAFTNHDGHCIL